MRKKVILLFFVSMLILVTACKSDNSVKVYGNTEDVDITHEEVTLTAVVTNIDLENNIITFMECITGETYTLLYNGGVSVLNTHDKDIGISALELGAIVDATYYMDTCKLSGIRLSEEATVLEEVTKLSIDVAEQKARYKGTVCPISENLVAFDGDKQIDPMEINTEDMVTLNIYGGRIMSVTIDLGHGYVKLTNQRTYVGGMVEIGYDVIVPVTQDMLLTVREGEYTLRINKDGYCNSKSVTVQRGRETVVDLLDISVPMGSVTFDVEPMEAELYVDGVLKAGHTFSALYGSYDVKLVAEGYESFHGRIRISDSTKKIRISLRALSDSTTEDNTEDDDTEDAEYTDDEPSGSAVTGGEDDGPDTGTQSGPSSPAEDPELTEKDSEDDGIETANKVTISAPIGASVYIDGDYVGTAPVTFTKVTGSHTVTLYKKGYLIKSYTIQAENNGKDDSYSFAELTSLYDMIE